MTLKTCTVAVEDLANVIHSVNVTAETLYEAVAHALATLRGEPWVAEIGKGLTTVTVKARQPEVTHHVSPSELTTVAEQLIQNQLLDRGIKAIHQTRAFPRATLLIFSDRILDS